MPALVLHTRALVLRVRAPALSTPAPTLHVLALALRGCPLAVPRVLALPRRRLPAPAALRAPALLHRSQVLSVNAPPPWVSSARPNPKGLELLKQAISNFRVLISAENAFPDHDTEVEFVGRAWNGACHTLKLSMELTPNIAKLIANRGSHLRGELKTKIKPLIEITYGFNNGQNKKSIARNRVLAEELKDGCTFAFKDIKERKGMYKNTILQTAVNAMWFANRRDEGAMYPEYIDPFPLQAFGLTLAVIENLIDQYATGIRTETPFTANDYRGVYEAHCKALLEFQEHTEPYPILHGILSRMHNLGRFHSGAQPLSICGVSLLNKSDLDAAIKEFAEDSSTESEGEYGPADEQ
ncbi:hypothetical protein C8J57DRAFT_1583232 [Mycena rebaudengoi]|nr:hypothetical protein C8J57DRAFT_1583232 [Mycena rebaudengoi]